MVPRRGRKWFVRMNRRDVRSPGHPKRMLQKNNLQSKKSPTGPTEQTPKPEYLIARSQLPERDPLGFGPIQFLMDTGSLRLVKSIFALTDSWFWIQETWKNARVLFLVFWMAIPMSILMIQKFYHLYFPIFQSSSSSIHVLNPYIPSPFTPSPP